MYVTKVKARERAASPEVVARVNKKQKKKNLETFIDGIIRI